MSGPVSVSIFGRDFSPVSDARIELLCPEGSPLREMEPGKLAVQLLEAIDDEKLPLVNKSGSNGALKYARLISRETMGDGKRYFGGVVGVLRRRVELKLGENTSVFVEVKVQLASRLDGVRPYFLSTMLLRDKLKLNDSNVPSDEEELYDYLLLFWYKEQLRRACLKGFYRTYRRFERNDDRVKGAIDIPRHIRLNMGQNNGRVAYAYRENTVNNLLNHLIVAAYYHLKKKFPDLMGENFDNDRELQAAVEGLEREIGYTQTNLYTLISKNLKSIAHPYYTEYEQLRQTCLRILRDEGLSFFDGETEEDVQGVLFYLPDLWELYLEDRFRTWGLEVEAQKNIRVFNAQQITRPDFLFRDGKRYYMVLDAKFRPAWEKCFREERIQEDEQQKAKSLSSHHLTGDYDKCMRDMTSISGHATGIIFPTNRPTDDLERRNEINKYNKTDIFYTIPIHIPRDGEKGYGGWKAALEDSLERAREDVTEITGRERELARKLWELEEERLKLIQSCRIEKGAPVSEKSD